MLRILLQIVAIFVTPACGTLVNKPVETTSDIRLLNYQFSYYESQARFGWETEPDSCDSILFASLSAIARDREFDIEEARDENGMWHRRPAMDCHLQPNGSTISRDMFVGIFAYILHFRRLDLAQQIWNYGIDHNWKMGIETRDLDNRTIFTPSTIGLLARIIRHLGGEDHPERFIPGVYSVEPGYRSHLTLLSIWMESIIRKGILDTELVYIEGILKHMSRNPLALALYARYTNGNQDRAIEELTSVWPHNRLPTTADWCEGWRLQRSDNDSGFNSCSYGNRPKEHSGGDFLFAARIVLGKD